MDSVWVPAVLVLVAWTWTVWLTRAVVYGGDPDDRGNEIGGVRPGEIEREPDAVTAYHYRTSSRFGEYVQLQGDGDVLRISGRRLGVGTYTFFIGLQTLLMALSPAAFLLAVLRGEWWWVLIGTGLFMSFTFASAAMAGGLWEGPGIGACQEPATLPRVELPLDSVSDVRIGRGWSRRRLGWVVWPFVRPIDALAAQNAVSFEAPDPTTGRRVVYAMHFYTPEEARRLAAAVGRRHTQSGAETGARL